MHLLGCKGYCVHGAHAQKITHAEKELINAHGAHAREVANAHAQEMVNANWAQKITHAQKNHTGPMPIK